MAAAYRAGHSFDVGRVLRDVIRHGKTSAGYASRGAGTAVGSVHLHCPMQMRSRNRALGPKPATDSSLSRLPIRSERADRPPAG